MSGGAANEGGDFQIVVLSGPSGSGKTTVVDQLIETSPVKLLKAVSATTRPPRQGELDAARVAQTLLDGFPRHLALTGVRFDKSGSIGPSLFEGKWQMTPLSFTYINIS